MWCPDSESNQGHGDFQNSCQIWLLIIHLAGVPHLALNYQTPSEFAVRWRNGKCEGKQTDITN
jgi:hypothetical protein